MKFLSEVISRRAGQTSLSLQQNSPKILFGVGILSMLGSTVTACRATLRLQDVLEEARLDIDVEKKVLEQHSEQYSEEESQRNTAVIYGRAGVKIAKLYAPAVGLGVIGVASLTKSHNILEDRYAGIAAAYTVLDKGFREYRQRVIDKYGEDEDRYFRYDTEVVTEGGKGKKEKTEYRVGPDAASIYARYFDKGSPMWEPQPEYNAFFLKCQQNYWNDCLHARGHVFLNEVYDSLGIPRSKAGAHVGWALSHHSDNYVDFGVFSDKDPDRVRNFMNGMEGSVLLDFNVDGIIFDKLPE